LHKSNAAVPLVLQGWLSHTKCINPMQQLTPLQGVLLRNSDPGDAVAKPQALSGYYLVCCCCHTPASVLAHVQCAHWRSIWYGSNLPRLHISNSSGAETDMMVSMAVFLACALYLFLQALCCCRAYSKQPGELHPSARSEHWQ
jgi:hypothetical protein